MGVLAKRILGTWKCSDLYLGHKEMECSYRGSSGWTLVKGFPPEGGQALQKSPGSGCGTTSARAAGMCGWCSWTRGVVSDTPVRSRAGQDVSLPTRDSLRFSYVPRISVGDFSGTRGLFFWNLNWPADNSQEH